MYLDRALAAYNKEATATQSPRLGDLISPAQWVTWQQDGIICMRARARNSIHEVVIWDPNPETRHPLIKSETDLHHAIVWTTDNWWSAEWVPEEGDLLMDNLKPHLRWTNHARPPLPPRT